MSHKAIVFDLDGTLVDTLPDLSAAVSQLLAERGVAAPDAGIVRQMVGDGARKLVERALTWAVGSIDAASLGVAHQRFLAIYEAAPCQSSRVFANVETTLDRLEAAGLALGVCTNKPQAPTDTILTELGLARRFQSVVGGDAVARRKPHPDHLMAVLEALHVRSNQAVMVGDSRNDLEAARACRVKCVLVDFGYSAEPVEGLGADSVISDFAELGQALDRLADDRGGTPG